MTSGHAATAPRRVLLKLSGEALMGERPYGIDPNVVREIAGQVGTAQREGMQVALVVGGGNIFRGLAAAPSPGWTGPPATTWACSPP